MVARSWREGEWEMTANGCGVFSRDENVLEPDNGGGATTWLQHTTEWCVFKGRIL